MRKKWYYLLLITSVLLLLVACSGNAEESPQEEANSAEQEEETVETEGDEDLNETEGNEDNNWFEQVEVPPIPSDEKGVAEQLPGPFANADNIYDMEEEVKKEFEEIGSMSENPSEEEYEAYLRYMYSLVAIDYPNPEDIMKKWEFGSFGNPDLPDSRYHFKENYNVEILLDSSGSMANYAEDKTRMQVAKEAITKFLSSVPEEANVSLRVYGHEGTGSESDKAMSCDSIEQVYGYDSYDESAFEESLNQFDPAGWTPLADALETAHESMESFNTEENTNLIYVVSDGIETCDGDPVDVAETLSQSNVEPIINIIGFQTDAEAQKQLEEMAEVANGIFTSASNQDELQAEFDRAEEVLEAWEDWKTDALADADRARLDNNIDIMEIHNEWNLNTTNMDNNLHALAEVMEDLEIVTRDQKQELNKRRGEAMDEIGNAVSDSEDRMEEINSKNNEEMIQEIEDRYEQSQE
ncbi:VWA domain-containing protein [Virgibacillus sp. NKC19-16]|uniref:VWA domain-containing protein n=1 Tax=Virgibacillus salidurans TaxID=2831673 RepID=UPI001F26DCD9|nr:VWA domain-containing protein [Virgibacillus sp. NKC19-16]UJL47026.1 VWA domain-containing protein [Virgibacillus sp. NKC19-16]